MKTQFIERDKLGRFVNGHRPLFEGWKIISNNHRKAISRSLKGKKNHEHSIRMKELWKNPEYKKRQIESHKKHRSKKIVLSREERSRLHSKVMKNLWKNESYKAKQKNVRGDAWKAKISKANKGKKRNPYTKEQIKSMLRRRIPSSLEKKFINLINKYNLPYKYVGDGSFILANCNPDFININGKKIAIEVYARYYKKKDGRNIDKWKSERILKFNKFGWELIFFDESQVNENNVLNTLERRY